MRLRFNDIVSELDWRFISKYLSTFFQLRFRSRLIRLDSYLVSELDSDLEMVPELDSDSDLVSEWDTDSDLVQIYWSFILARFARLSKNTLSR